MLINRRELNFQYISIHQDDTPETLSLLLHGLKQVTIEPDRYSQSQTKTM